MKTPASLLTAQALTPWGGELESPTRDSKVRYRFFMLGESTVPNVAQVSWGSNCVPMFMLDMGIRYVITTAGVLDTAIELSRSERGGTVFGSFLHAYIKAGEADLAVNWEVPA